MSNKLDHKQAASLKQILEKSKLLNNKILEKELPSLERGLEQIDTQTKQLSTQSVHDEAKDIHAYDKLVLLYTYIICHL
jgi:regulator of replication initiation timing